MAEKESSSLIAQYIKRFRENPPTNASERKQLATRDSFWWIDETKKSSEYDHDDGDKSIESFEDSRSLIEPQFVVGSSTVASVSESPRTSFDLDAFTKRLLGKCDDLLNDYQKKTGHNVRDSSASSDVISGVIDEDSDESSNQSEDTSSTVSEDEEENANENRNSKLTIVDKIDKGISTDSVEAASPISTKITSEDAIIQTDFELPTDNNSPTEVVSVTETGPSKEIDGKSPPLSPRMQSASPINVQETLLSPAFTISPNASLNNQGWIDWNEPTKSVNNSNNEDGSVFMFISSSTIGDKTKSSAASPDKSKLSIHSTVTINSPTKVPQIVVSELNKSDCNPMDDWKQEKEPFRTEMSNSSVVSSVVPNGCKLSEVVVNEELVSPYLHDPILANLWERLKHVNSLLEKAQKE